MDEAISSEAVVREPETTVPVFPHEGRLGQFTLVLAAFAFSPRQVRAVLDQVWPVEIKPLEAPDQGRVLHVLAYSGLFRKLTVEGEPIPAYLFDLKVEADGSVGVSVIEQPVPLVPEQQRIIVPPNRQARREIARHAKHNGSDVITPQG